MGLEELYEWVHRRRCRKEEKAQEAFVSLKRQKRTENCYHCGPEISNNIFGCKILAMGADGAEAATCHNRKASYCPKFQLQNTLEGFRRQFREMSEEELHIRWPSIGELLRIEQKILEELDNDGSKGD